MDLNQKKPAAKPLPKAKPKADTLPATRSLATDMLREASAAKHNVNDPSIEVIYPKGSTASTTKKR